MPQFRRFQTNFSGGLLSDGMRGRLDLAQYENGCLKLKNWWPKVTGGMTRRPGTKYLATLGSSDCRIESFIFDETQTYAVIFGEFSWKVWSDQSQSIVASGTHNYDSTEIPELSITQLADKMFIAHTSEKTKVLTRTGASTFTWTDFNFEGQPPLGAYPLFVPFYKFADPEVTITPSGFAKNQTINIVASSAVFHDNLVGRAIRYRGKQIYITAFNTTTNLLGTILEELDQGATIFITQSESEPEDFEVGEIVVGRDSGVKAEVISTDNNNITVSLLAGRFPASTNEQIEGLTSGNIATISSVILTSPPASADWDEEAFSNVRGWPGIVEFHSQRLWLGGSSSLPAHIFGSKVAAFFNFDVGDALADESIQAAIVDKQIGTITDIVSGQHMHIFTDAAEYWVPETDDLPVTPTTFNPSPITRYGSKKRVEPKVLDEGTLFVQAKGNNVRELLWQNTARGYSADSISMIAEDYLNDVQEMEVLYGGYDRPEQIAFFVNGDGTLTHYHSMRAENVRTWGQWDTNGLFKSLAIVRDKLYAIVQRTINGTTQRFLEEFSFDVTVDCAVSATNSFGSKSWPAVASHLPNTDVDVVAGWDFVVPTPDFFVGNETLNTDGDLTSNSKTTNVTVGLGFTQELTPMPFEGQDQLGITGGLPKRVVSVDLYLTNTLAISVEGQRITAHKATDDWTRPPTKITGSRKVYLSGYSERPTVDITNEIPLPCEINALNAEIEY